MVRAHGKVTYRNTEITNSCIIQEKLSEKNYRPMLKLYIRKALHFCIYTKYLYWKRGIVFNIKSSSQHEIGLIIFTNIIP